MLYVDTSVWVAALTRETRTAEMQAWLAAQAPGSLAISDWVGTEFASALAMKLRMEILSPTERAEVLAAFTALEEASLHTLPVSRLDYRIATQFVHHHSTGLRAGDALHLAIAANHGHHLHTLDTTLATAAEHLGVSARLL
jgi:uncharacterized protein